MNKLGKENTMKTRKCFILCFICILLLSLCSCGKKEEPVEPEAKPSYEIAGKTYFNTVDNYGHEDHSKLWLGKDGTFVMADSYSDGVKDITGKWTLNEDVLTLESDDGKKIIFEVKDDDSLTLKSSLDGSKSDDSFSTTEVKGSSVEPKTDTSTESKPEEKPESKPEEKTDTSSESSSTSAATEPEKKADVPCTGITSLYHNYWSYEGTKNWDLEIKAQPEGCTDKMTFKSNDESIVKIDDQGRATAVGVGKTTIDVTCGGKKLTIGYEVKSKTATAGGASKWVCKNPNAADGYWPNISFDGKGNFVFEENGYSGMGYFTGTYKLEDGRYYCNVNDISAPSCSMPDLSEIVFKVVDEKTLKLKTNVAMSVNGDLFYLAD